MIVCDFCGAPVPLKSYRVAISDNSSNMCHANTYINTICPHCADTIKGMLNASLLKSSDVVPIRPTLDDIKMFLDKDKEAKG